MSCEEELKEELKRLELKFSVFKAEVENVIVPRLEQLLVILGEVAKVKKELKEKVEELESRISELESKTSKRRWWRIR